MRQKRDLKETQIPQKGPLVDPGTIKGTQLDTVQLTVLTETDERAATLLINILPTGPQARFF